MIARNLPPYRRHLKRYTPLGLWSATIGPKNILATMLAIADVVKIRDAWRKRAAKLLRQQGEKQNNERIGKVREGEVYHASRNAQPTFSGVPHVHVAPFLP